MIEDGGRVCHTCQQYNGKMKWTAALSPSSKMDQLPRDITQIVHRYVHKSQLQRVNIEVLKATTAIKTEFDVNVKRGCEDRTAVYSACKRCKRWYIVGMLYEVPKSHLKCNNLIFMLHQIRHQVYDCELR